MFKKLMLALMSVVVLVSSVAFASSATIPEPPAGSTGNTGIILYSNTYNTYYYMQIDHSLDYANPIVEDDDSLVIDNAYSVNNCYFRWYKLVDGEWTLPDSTMYYALPNISSYTVISSSEDINYRSGGTFFQLADNLNLTLPGIHQIRIVPQALTENLPILIPVGLIALAVLFGTRLVPRLIHLFLQ